MKKNNSIAKYLVFLSVVFAGLLIAKNIDQSENSLGINEITLKNGEVVGLGCIKETELPNWIIPSPKIYSERSSKSSADLSDNFPPIKSQGGQGSCTAWATAYYFKSYQEWQEHDWDLNSTDHQFSPAFIYNHINGGEDRGSMITDAFKAFRDLGCGVWSDMPYTDANFTAMPNEATYRYGINFRTMESFAIDLSSNISDLKNLVLNGSPAVIGISVYPNFDNIESYGNVYCLSDVYGSLRGGHAVTICGFDDNKITNDGTGAFKLSNSWGPSFGDSGYWWMSYEAVQSSMLCHGYAYYATDKIDYEPQLISTINLSYDIRAAVDITFGVGENSTPDWSKKFFDWELRKLTALPFQSTNVVIDLTDGKEYLDQPQTSQVFLRCKDRRFFWHTSTQHAYSGKSWWCADEDIPGYDNGWLMFLTTPEIELGSDGGTFSFMLSYALEEPGNYENYNGWDAANVRISTNNGQTWSTLYGTPSYDFTSGYGWGYNDEGPYIPGWGGYHPDFQNASFDLSSYANQNVKLRIAFGSDPGWCSRDDYSYFGLVVDDLTVTSDGNVVYYDDAESAKNDNSINYMDVEDVVMGMTPICEDTPLIIPDNGEFAFANVLFMEQGMLGDVYPDSTIDVADIVTLVNFILALDTPDPYERWAGDVTGDGNLNVLDIIQLVNIILDIDPRY